MARFMEVLPRKLVVLVLTPLVAGLVLLVALVDLPPDAWALIYLVVVGGVLVMVLIALHVYLLEYQQGETGD